MVRLLIALAAFGCVAFGIARGVPAWLAHADARATYEQESARVGREDYSAARSDEAYARARASHAETGYAALLVALGLVFFGALDRPRIAHPPNEAPRASRPPDPPDALARAASALRSRAVLGLLVDVTLIGTGVGLAFLDDAESATLHAVARAAPLVAVGGEWVALGRGSTFGLRSVGLGVDRASLMRAGLAMLTLPFAAALVPFTLGRSATWHLRLAGLDVARR
ncbi:MAG: hypothetical protein H6721_21475 [Sandaracinus sp.]|nr:hypothetical protein [Sandaracinus sp.]